MKNSARLPMLAASIALIALVGCDPKAKPPSGRSDPLPDEQYGKIQALGRLNKHLFFKPPIVTPAEGDDVMLVEVPVRNRTDVLLNVQYRFEFFDRRGRLLTRDERWVFAQLDPKIDHRMTGTGTHPDAVDWRLVVRPAE